MPGGTVYEPFVTPPLLVKGARKFLYGLGYPTVIFHGIDDDNIERHGFFREQGIGNPLDFFPVLFGDQIDAIPKKSFVGGCCDINQLAVSRE